MFLGFSLILAFVMGGLIWGLSFFLFSIAMKSASEKLSPFECGFEASKLAHTPHSLRFFLLCILFLIFDIELSVLAPLVFYSMLVNSSLFFIGLGFSIIMIGGSFFELEYGSISWLF